MDQIGNTITYYTRAHVVKNEDVSDVSIDSPAEDAQIGMDLEENKRWQKLAGIVKG